MTYWMLFQYAPQAAVDTPLGVYVSREDVRAMCVFSSDEKAAAAQTQVPEAHGYYMESVQPDDVAALAVMHGIDVVALDAWVAEKAALIPTTDVVSALGT